MGSSTESQDNEGYADTSAFKMNEWITLLFSPTHKGAVNNNGTLPRAEVTTAVTSCSSPTLVEMPPLKKTMDWWMMTMRPRIGVFWSVVLALLALYALFMVRVYVIATQDPDGRAAQLATECKHKGQGKQEIPKLLHQIWNDEHVPDKWKSAIDSCRRMNPDYTYKLWTMKEIEKLVRKEYGWFSTTFTDYRYPMQKGDAARYVLLHKFGGIYLDLDITCMVSMETALSAVNLGQVDTIAGDAPGPGVIDTPILASKPGNPFMEFCLRKLRVMNHSHLLPFLTVFFSTGPYFLSLTYLQYPCKDTIHRIDILYTRSLYFHHQHSASWQKWDYYIIKFFEHYFLPLAFLVILAKILLPMRTRIKGLLRKLKILGTL